MQAFISLILLMAVYVAPANGEIWRDAQARTYLKNAGLTVQNWAKIGLVDDKLIKGLVYLKQASKCQTFELMQVMPSEYNEFELNARVRKAACITNYFNVNPISIQHKNDKGWYRHQDVNGLMLYVPAVPVAAEPAELITFDDFKQ